jgi:hypothetical protein
MMKTFSAAFTVCLMFFATVAFADQNVLGYKQIPPEVIAAWKAAAARAGSNRTYVDPYCHRTSLNGTVSISCKGPPIHVTLHVTGAGATYRYIQDKSSPYYQGPDIYGRIDYDGVSDPPAPPAHRDLNSVSLCPPPHFRITERDGCQPVR